MEIDNERVQTIGRMFHQFYDKIVQLDINENEWDEFMNNKRRVYESIGLPIHTFQMDESGSRWLEYEETEEQDEDFYLYQRNFNDELEDIVVKWIIKHQKRGWEHFMTFLNNKRYEFLNDIQTYYLFHGSSYGEDESDSDGLEKMMKEFESLPLPKVEMEDDDGINVDEIIKSLTNDDEEYEDWVEDPPMELFDDEEETDENTDGEPR